MERVFWRSLTILSDARIEPYKLGDAVYVLHAFQKKSTRGIATRKEDIELIEQRLKQARAHYEQEYGQ